MRDFFENSVKNVEITAQVVAPEVFAEKTTVQSNNAQLGESFTVFGATTVDLASHIANNTTVTLVASGAINGTLNSASITGTVATVTHDVGLSTVYIDYTVSDGTNTSPVYRITFINNDD